MGTLNFNQIKSATAKSLLSNTLDWIPSFPTTLGLLVPVLNKRNRDMDMGSEQFLGVPCIPFKEPPNFLQ